MGCEAKILADSINARGDRLTTFEVTMARIVLAEFNTHRMLSRNSASTRAIPVEKQIRRVLDDPYIPTYWGVNRSGMQAREELDKDEAAIARATWLRSRSYAVSGAVALIGGLDALKDDRLRERVSRLQDELGYRALVLTRPVHKQTAGRLLETFMWHTVITTATDWSNFFALRANSQAHPDIEQVAAAMRDLYCGSEPVLLEKGEWHTPLIQPDEQALPPKLRIKMSVGRCARVSYLTHDGTRDHAKDIALYEQLLAAGHMSPFEHVARPMTARERWFGLRPYRGNFRGWHQHRKDIPHEADFSLITQAT